MEGWIKLHRTVEDHWVWKNHKYALAWVHCLFRANYKTTKVLIDGELQEVLRGEFITSLHKFAEEVQMSPQQVRTFWALLEKDSMILKKSTKTSTKITVCNYDSYQDHQQDEQHPGNKPATNQQQQRKKERIERREENISLSDPKGSDLVEKNVPDKTKTKLYQETMSCMKYARSLARIVQTQKDIDISHQQKWAWAGEFRKLVLTVEHVPRERVSDALDWYRENVGREYVPVIESGKSFRSKFVKLEDAMKRDKKRVNHSPAGKRAVKLGRFDEDKEVTTLKVRP